MTEIRDDHADRRPARTSTAVALVVTAAAVVLVLRQLPDLVVPAVVGAGGALSLGVALWLASGTETPQSAFAASLLAVPASVGLFGSLYVAVLVVVVTVFPVEDTALLSVGTLVILGHAGVVLGCTVAALGVVLTLVPTADSGLFDRYSRVVLAAGAVAVLTGVALAALALLSGTAPGFLLARLGSTVAGVVLLAVVAGFVGYGLWLLARGRGVAGRLDDPLRGGAVGGVLTAVAVAVAGPRLYTRLVAETAGRFPAAVGSDIRDTAFGPAQQLGEATVFVLVSVFLLGVTTWVVSMLRFVLAGGYISRRATGLSLASLGLFLSAVFAGIVGAPHWLVAVGIAASLVVWDAGRFGATLVQEVGHGRWGPELVHAGATTLVGVVGVLVTLALDSLLTGVTNDSASVLTLWSVVAGLVLLAAALR